MIVPLTVAGVGLLVLGWGLDGWVRRTPVEGRPGRLVRRVWVPLLASTPACVVVGLSAADGGGLLRDQMALHAQAKVLAAGLLTPVLATMVALVLLIPGALAWGGDAWDRDRRMVLRWPVIGVIVLLVAVAGRLPDSGMLVLFALGSVLAWAESIPRSHETWGGPAMGWLCLALVGSAGMAMGLNWLPGVQGAGIGAIAIVVVCWRVVVRHGSSAGIESAMWTACIGSLLITGMLGLEALQASFGGHLRSVGVTQVPMVGSLVQLTAPALAVLISCGVLAGFGWWPRRGRIGALAAGLLVQVGLCGWLVLIASAP